MTEGLKAAGVINVLGETFAEPVLAFVGGTGKIGVWVLGTLVGTAGTLICVLHFGQAIIVPGVAYCKTVLQEGQEN
jgi:hypothetical protein